MESTKPDCACAVQRKTPENLAAGFDATLSPVRFEGARPTELRRFSAILAVMQLNFSATQTEWRREWDSKTLRNVHSIRYSATDGEPSEAWMTFSCETQSKYQLRQI